MPLKKKSLSTGGGKKKASVKFVSQASYREEDVEVEGEDDEGDEGVEDLEERIQHAQAEIDLIRASLPSSGHHHRHQEHGGESHTQHHSGEHEQLPVQHPPPQHSQSHSESTIALSQEQVALLEELWLYCSQGHDQSLVHIFHALRELPRSVLDIGDELRAGKTALIFAAEKNHIDYVKSLVEHGACVNVANAKGSTAVLMATFNGHLPILQYLADAGADMEMANCDGYTPTLIAAREGRAACLQYLLELGCDIHRKNKHNDTSVTLAAMHGHVVCLELLIEEGVKPDHSNIEGITPVMNASAEGEFECLATLLRYDADFHAVDNKGMNALMYAAQCGSFDCANLLVKKGADMGAQSYAEGKTAAHWAAEHSDSAVLEMLVENGTDVFLPDAEGLSVLKLYAASEYATISLLKKMILGTSSKKRAASVSRSQAAHSADPSTHRFSLGGEKLFPGQAVAASSVRYQVPPPLHYSEPPPQYEQRAPAPAPHAPAPHAPAHVPQMPPSPLAHMFPVAPPLPPVYAPPAAYSAPAPQAQMYAPAPANLLPRPVPPTPPTPPSMLRSY